MTKAIWFDVDLDTLRLRPASPGDWSGGMSSVKRRMKEECLESIIAFNLDVLFPGEDLLLVGTQTQMNRAADVTAIDPLGMLRVMELKRTPAKRGDLEDQVISYAVSGEGLSQWQEALAEHVTFLPERVQIAIEGFACNARAKALGKDTVWDIDPDAEFEGLNRFDRAGALANALRAGRGAKAAPATLRDPRVAEVCGRLYPVALKRLAYGEPPEVVAEVVRRKWKRPPRVSMTEFTLIAPGIAEGDAAADELESSLGSDLERRKVRFNFIDAELRHVPSARGGTSRAVLRWQPCRRTVDSTGLRKFIDLKKQVMDVDDQAGQFYCDFDEEEPYVYWDDLAAAIWMVVTEDKEGRPVLATGANQMRQGLAGLRAARQEKLIGLGSGMKRAGIRPFTKGGELAAPWRKDLQPPQELLVAYYHLMKSLGFSDLYRWHRRPPAEA